MNEYERGDRVKITTSTAFQDSASTEFDPNTVTFSVMDPENSVVNYVYGTDANVTKTGTGLYACEVDVETPGLWRYRIFGESSGGENRGADEGSFRVNSYF